VNGVPSWNSTPWRSARVKTLLFVDTFQLVARSGMIVGVGVPPSYCSRPW
jgi:hypothetical protein